MSPLEKLPRDRALGVEAVVEVTGRSLGADGGSIRIERTSPTERAGPMARCHCHGLVQKE